MAEKSAVLDITGMTCDHCEEAVLRAINSVPGIMTSKVSLSDEKASLTYDDTKAKVSDFIGAIDLAGYGASVA